MKNINIPLLAISALITVTIVWASNNVDFVEDLIG